MATYSTPGVYINEVNAFPDTVVGVATSIPVFIGYTGFALAEGKSLSGNPTPIGSLLEYIEFFGRGFKTKFNVISPYQPAVPDPTVNPDTIAVNQPVSVLSLNNESYGIEVVQNTRAYLYDCIRMFYMNGGGKCYIVSVGQYSNQTNGISISTADLNGPLGPSGSLNYELEPTMVVIPDAVGLSANDCYALYNQVLTHCALVQTRVGIFDTIRPMADGSDLDHIVSTFRNQIGMTNLNYGAAYFPWINTSMDRDGEIDFESLNIDLSSTAAFSRICPEPPATVALQNFLNYQAGYMVLQAELDAAHAAQPQVPAAIAAAQAAVTAYLAGDTPDLKNAKQECQQNLIASSPTFKALMDEMTSMINVLSSSAAVAGIYTTVDSSKGVWSAPADVAIACALSPSVPLSDLQQDALNMDQATGKSINAIRAFVGQGTLVWGCRTLDGNSEDWRYINIRRFMIYLEQSIKQAANAYAFEPNTTATWTALQGKLEAFMTNLWKEGGLLGTTAAEAFDVEIGLGTTMTAQDILDGFMKITVKVAVTHPAEYLVITFQQQMQAA